ncbi:sulfite exporter TauE/SafE family protein [Ostreibacterium oceani]|uniref:Probable membrane transporter protein n=1 Tax=Ostreibacterium oceani TaxID=2654998 RepID=A0A6N7EV54_9GAMM|nr:TSUP family transporter [Ostreibacterium oceani]MPV85410.1 TSUP family transporter [Ostreibacterium oceani]
MVDWIGEFSVWVIALLILTGFVAGYIDAIAGGGGMIQTLALLMTGLPAVNVIATNKMASIAGTSIAVFKYARAKQIPWRLVGYCALPCLLAAALGSQLVMLFADAVIVTLLILCIPFALVVMMKKPKRLSQVDTPASTATADPIAVDPITNKPLTAKQLRRRAALLLSPIAFYDGLIGPGTGAYMAIAGNRGLGLRFLTGTGLAKPLNLCTNLGSVVVFVIAGKIVWAIAIPMAIASMFGAYIGSHSAIKYGDGFIKKVIVGMLLLMLAVNLIKLVLN